MHTNKQASKQINKHKYNTYTLIYIEFFAACLFYFIIIIILLVFFFINISATAKQAKIKRNNYKFKKDDETNKQTKIT